MVAQEQWEGEELSIRRGRDLCDRCGRGDPGLAAQSLGGSRVPSLAPEMAQHTEVGKAQLLSGGCSTNMQGNKDPTQPGLTPKVSWGLNKHHVFEPLCCAGSTQELLEPRQWNNFANHAEREPWCAPNPPSPQTFTWD